MIKQNHHMNQNYLEYFLNEKFENKIKIKKNKSFIKKYLVDDKIILICYITFHF